ncbi:flippase [Muribaculum intestinale]|uniref:flippase n=1 Tax=Muribaculum intestinale TaxID=1796646 RepID=UPI0025A943E8|nr:flippase [Muribaculum intestinale]
MPSIKKNILYSIILSSSQYLVPLIVFPYISRVLGPDKLGLVNFIDGTIDYFIILSMLGMGTLGIREVALHKNNPKNLKSVFSSLIFLNLISTLIACCLLILSFFIFDSLRANPTLMLIGAIKLLFNVMLTEWLYKGLEEFRFITIRTLIVRLIFIISIFLFVRKSSDFISYYIILTGTVVGNALINIIHSRHYVHLQFSNIKITRFIKPFIILGGYTILTAMYTTFNIMYLGMISNDTEVAYYTTSCKIYGIVIAMFTAFTGVMMPRLSSLLADGQEDEFKRYIFKSIDLLMTFSIPIIAFGIVMAPEIVNLISGPGYEGTITPMRIVMPLVFIIGCEQIFVYQILIPTKKDHTVFINSIIGAVLGVSLNILIVQKLGAVGSSIVWVSSECCIFLLSQIAVIRVKNINFPYSNFFKYLTIFIPLSIILLVIKKHICNSYMTLLLGILILIAYTIAAQLLFLRNPEFISTIGKMTKYIKNTLHNN